MNQIQKTTDRLTPEVIGESWAALREQIQRADRATASAVKEIVIAGDMMTTLKAECKHGEFGPELHRQCFGEMDWGTFAAGQWRKANRWMQIAEAVREKLQIRHDVQFAPGGEFSLGKLLAWDGENLPEEALQIKEKADDIVASNTATQLLLDLRGGPHQKFHPRKAKAQLKLEDAEAAREAFDDTLRAMLIPMQHEWWARLNDADQRRYRADILARATELKAFVGQLKLKC